MVAEWTSIHPTTMKIRIVPMTSEVIAPARPRPLRREAGEHASAQIVEHAVEPRTTRPQLLLDPAQRQQVPLFHSASSPR